MTTLYQMLETLDERGKLIANLGAWRLGNKLANAERDLDLWQKDLVRQDNIQAEILAAVAAGDRELVKYWRNQEKLQGQVLKMSEDLARDSFAEFERAFRKLVPRPAAGPMLGDISKGSEKR